MEIQIINFILSFLWLLQERNFRNLKVIFEHITKQHKSGFDVRKSYRLEGI